MYMTSKASDDLLQHLEDITKMKKLEKDLDDDNAVKPFKRKIVWFNALGFLALHLTALYGLYLCFTSAKLLTSLWVYFLVWSTGTIGVTMGAHRLYSHKTFKCNTALKVLIMIMQTMAGQNCMYIWVRDHRQHHKYSDSDADPHNSKNGFFFSHIGWLMVRKHPDVIAKGSTVDMSDLEADPIVMFQKKYYKTLYTLFSIGVPTAVSMLWGETLYNSFLISFVTRSVLLHNITWTVNSLAHLYGTRPYTRDLDPCENRFVGIIANGEGWHNYHHSFPWDYRAAELGHYFNGTTQMIDFFAWLGWAHDRKTVNPEMMKSRILSRGDGTHPRLTEIRLEKANKLYLTAPYTKDSTPHVRSRVAMHG